VGTPVSPKITPPVAVSIFVRAKRTAAVVPAPSTPFVSA